MKVYLVKLEWATEDSDSIELNIYSAYEKAYQKFNDLIAEEMKPENSWVGELNGKTVHPKTNTLN